MDERLGIGIMYWDSAGWMVSIHLTTEGLNRREHWMSPGYRVPLHDRVHQVREVLAAWEDWGGPSLPMVLEGWDYTLDQESASAVSTFPGPRL